MWNQNSLSKPNDFKDTAFKVSNFFQILLFKAVLSCFEQILTMQACFFFKKKKTTLIKGTQRRCKGTHRWPHSPSDLKILKSTIYYQTIYVSKMWGLYKTKYEVWTNHLYFNLGKLVFLRIGTVQEKSTKGKCHLNGVLLSLMVLVEQYLQHLQDLLRLNRLCLCHWRLTSTKHRPAHRQTGRLLQFR